MSNNTSKVIAIESGIPIPKNNRGCKGIYPWRDMEVGQSFFVARGNVRTLNSSAGCASRRLGRKFISRVMDGGVRVWRIA